MAIVAETPERAFKIFDKVKRVIANVLATCPIVISAGMYSLSTSPGCAGLNILVIAISFISDSSDSQPKKHPYQQK
jgi:hypothetical protein